MSATTLTLQGKLEVIVGLYLNLPERVHLSPDLFCDSPQAGTDCLFASYKSNTVYNCMTVWL